MMEGFALSLMGSVGEFVGGFTMKQMIAIGAVVLLAVLLGLFFGGIAFYRSGIRKGKRKGLKDAVTIALQKAEEKAAEERERLRRESAFRAGPQR